MGRDERVDGQTAARDGGEPLKKRPYSKPALHEYGSIAKLTQSGGTTKSEAGGMKSCL
jgi:hypothetical protein